MDLIQSYAYLMWGEEEQLNIIQVAQLYGRNVPVGDHNNDVASNVKNCI